MSQQNINIGASANDKSGDPLRVAFTKVNANFTELYTRGTTTDRLVNGGNSVILGSNGNLTLLGGMNISQSITWTGNSQIYEDTLLVLQGSVGVAIASPGTTQITAGTTQWNFTNNGILTFPDGTTDNGSTIIAPGQYDIQSIGNTLIQTSAGAGAKTWTFGTNGTLTLPGGAISATSALTLNVPSGIPSSVSNWVGQGGWNQGFYSNLATTGGSGTGLTVNVAAGGGGYINITAITINNPGTGYTNGDVITINNENNLPGTFTISTAVNNWTFGTDGRATFPAATVPAHSYGNTGDKAGMLVFDSTYIYYCTANYVNTSTNIWKRIAWPNNTW